MLSNYNLKIKLLEKSIEISKSRFESRFGGAKLVVINVLGVLATSFCHFEARNRESMKTEKTLIPL